MAVINKYEMTLVDQEKRKNNINAKDEGRKSEVKSKRKYRRSLTVVPRLLLRVVKSCTGRRHHPTHADHTTRP
jgi:hypothetical protein